MTLKQCTKDELIRLINRIHIPNREYEIIRSLNEISYEREKKRLDEADNWARFSHDKRMEYCELLKPYAGWKFIDIPVEILEKAQACIDAAESADRKWTKLMDLEEDDDSADA